MCELEVASHCFYPVLEKVYSVINFIDYLRFRVLQVGLGTLFEMFGPSLQVIYEILCSHVGTGVFLNQKCQIN